jgi:hypothetical protein
MDDFWSSHDPASKPSDKNHIASPTDRQRARRCRCSLTKSSNSERIRSTTDFTARRREHESAPSRRPSRVFSALTALFVARCSVLLAARRTVTARAARRGACACHLQRGPASQAPSTHTACCRTPYDRPRSTRAAARQSALARCVTLVGSSIARELTCWQVDSRAHQLSFGRSCRASRTATNLPLLLRWTVLLAQQNRRRVCQS